MGAERPNPYRSQADLALEKVEKGGCMLDRRVHVLNDRLPGGHHAGSAAILCSTRDHGTSVAQLRLICEAQISAVCLRGGAIHERHHLSRWSGSGCSGRPFLPWAALRREDI